MDTDGIVNLNVSSHSTVLSLMIRVENDFDVEPAKKVTLCVSPV